MMISKSSFVDLWAPRRSSSRPNCTSTLGTSEVTGGAFLLKVLSIAQACRLRQQPSLVGLPEAYRSGLDW